MLTESGQNPPPNASRKISTTHLADTLPSTKLRTEGPTQLETVSIAHVASFGPLGFPTDVRIREFIHRPDARRYHAGSIARARRHLAELEFIKSVRIHAGHRPEGARYNSAHGTTEKRFCWSRVGLRSPITRAQARQARRANAAELRPQPAPAAPMPGRPRHSAPVPAPPPDPKLASVLDELETLYGPRWERELADDLQRSSASVPRRERPPD